MFFYQPLSKNLSTLSLTYPIKRSVNASISKLANKIFGNSEGVFRGFEFGQDLDEIILKEKFKVFEREKDYVGVSFSNSKMETIDILYFKNIFNKLEKIQVDVFLNSEQDSNQLFDYVFHQIFENHGFPIPIKHGYCWTRANEPKISLSKVNNKIEQGILLIFER